MSEIKDLTICSDAQIMLKKAQEDGIETAWDRLKKQNRNADTANWEYPAAFAPWDLAASTRSAKDRSWEFAAPTPI